MDGYIDTLEHVSDAHRFVLFKLAKVLIIKSLPIDRGAQWASNQ